MTNVRTLVASARQGDVAAIRTLSAMAAQCLSDRTPLPDDLADYLAFAFKRVASVNAASDGRPIEQAMISEFAHGLGMKRSANRPRLPSPDAEIIVAIAMYGDTLSQTAVAGALVATSDVKLRAAQYRVFDAKARIAKGNAEIWNAYIECLVAKSDVKPRAAPCQIVDEQADLGDAETEMRRLMEVNGLSSLVRPRYD